jgi:hypothetical protein
VARRVGAATSTAMKRAPFINPPLGTRPFGRLWPRF